MECIPVSENVIVAFRSELNAPVFLRETSPGFGEILVPYNGAWLCAKANQLGEVWAAMRAHAGEVVKLYDKRLTSVLFNDSSTWPAPNDSSCVFAPETGKKLIITSIQVRFPNNAQLTQENQLVFEVWLWDAANNVLARRIQLKYSSIPSLIRKSNSPISMPYDLIVEMSDHQMAEVTFKYADPFTLKGFPLVLHAAHGEYCTMYLEGNTPLTDVNQNAIGDCWAVVNGVQVVDF